MYIERVISKKLNQLTQVFPAVVISGARQVGKSTLVQKLFGQEGDYVLFDPIIDVENAKSDPELFLSNHTKRPLILDEIQYVPELVPVLKREIDRDRTPGQFIVTGSQQWEVMKHLSESLAGRAVFLELESFALCERADRLYEKTWLQAWLDDPEQFTQANLSRLPVEENIYEILWRGFLPDAITIPLETVPDFYSAYLKTYIERDVRQMTDVSDWQQFGRFVKLASALTGQEVNYSKIGRDISVTPQTARRWLSTLQATYQWFELPAYSGNTVKRISSKPKGYIADSGFACMSQAISTPNALATHPLLGNIFETAVVAEIRKMCSIMSPRPNLYHWRTSGGAEVDLILERDGIYYPMEMKIKSRPARKDARGIRAFRETYPHLEIAPGLVIAATQAISQISDHDFALPWDIAGINRII